MRRGILGLMVVMASPSGQPAHASSGAGTATFAATITYPASPWLDLGPNCDPTSWTLTDIVNGVGAAANIEGLGGFVGAINVSASGSSSCGNLLGESGTASLTMTSAPPNVGTFSCSNLPGGYVRTPAYFLLDVTGNCSVNGVAGVHFNWTYMAVPVVTSSTGAISFTSITVAGTAVGKWFGPDAEFEQ